jgi:signal transduction histidine kinase
MDRSTAPSPDLIDSRILVLDDEPTNVRLLERILADSGYTEVRGISDPREVEGLLLAFDPDLILLDLLMPHLDGFAIMELLQERTAQETFFPILVLTADATPKTKLRALSAGATDFLTKPFDQVEVLLRIRNLLETRKLHGRLQERNQVLNEAVKERTRELEEMIDDLRRIDQERRVLVDRLVFAQEHERGRIAQDIHDDTLQVMTAVGMRLEAIRRRTDGEQQGSLDQLKESVGGAIERLRHQLFDLRPRALDEEGLAATLRESLTYLEGQTQLQWRLENDLQEEPPLELRTVLYRVAREAITNVRKHADAHNIDVALKDAGDGYAVRIVDDGRGMEPVTARNGALPGRLGLPSMRERVELAGGWIRIHSLPGEGTAVEFWIPKRAGA